MSVLIIPAPLDPHVHLRGMDWSHKGTFASETTAALAGGYWAVLDMPNTPPATLTVETLARKRAAIAAEAVCDWGLYFGAGRAIDSARYAEVIQQVCGLKIYCNDTTGDLAIDDQKLRDAHFRAWPPQRPIAVHAEGETVAEVLALVRAHRLPTHFCHISTAEEIDLLTAAKADGLPVTIGVTPHHLFLTEDDLPTLGALGLMKPPLKTRADRDRLWAAIGAGIVDVIESDHAPHTLAEKAAAPAPYGVPGLETTLPLLGLAVREGRLTPAQIVELVAEAPRRIFRIAAPAATYTTLDLGATYLIEARSLRTACGWSPFDGWRVYGRVTSVTVRGRVVFDGERILAVPGEGQPVEQADL